MFGNRVWRNSSSSDKSGIAALYFDMFRSAVSKSVLNAARQNVSKTTVRPVIARGYHENVISHYEKPRNVSRLFFPISLGCNLSDNVSSSSIQVGSLPKGDIDVGTGLVGAPAYVAINYSLLRVKLMFLLQLRRRHETPNPRE